MDLLRDGLIFAHFDEFGYACRESQELLKMFRYPRKDWAVTSGLASMDQLAITTFGSNNGQSRREYCCMQLSPHLPCSLVALMSAPRRPFARNDIARGEWVGGGSIATGSACDNVVFTTLRQGGRQLRALYQ
jgi:hypothetical protein